MKLKVLPHIVYISILITCVCGISIEAQTLSQQGKIGDSIRGLLKEYTELFYENAKEEKDRRVYLLELAENLVQDIDAPYLKIEVNRKKIGFFLSNSDSLKIEKYLAKNLEIVNQLGDKRQLGLYYEDVGVHKSMQGKKEEGYQAYLIAEELLREYGEPKDVIDINYNLCARYIMIKDWNKAIEHAYKSLEAVNKTGVKKDRRRNLYLFLAECYTNLQRYKDTEYCFSKIKEEESEYINDLFFKGKLLYQKGLYYNSTGDFKQSSFFYNQSANNFLNHSRQRTKEVSDALALSNQLNIKEEENKRIRIENKLKEEQLSNRGYIIFIGVLIILGLVLVSILQYRTSSYKTKINELLKKNYQKIVKANQKVDKALRAKSEFLDSVTHELLTPLNTIKGTTFLLQKGILTEPQENQIKLINLSSDYLLKLINDVIHLNDLEKGELKLKKEHFDLKTLLNNLIDSSVLMKGGSNKIHRTIDDNIPNKLNGDMLKTSQVFLNVLDNALKFTRNGDIYVNVSLVSKTDSEVKIKFSVEDTGIGMSEKQINKAFETFRQGSVKINRKYGGTGLGLSIVKRILKLHGSDIVLDSELGKGTLALFNMDFDISEPVNIEFFLEGTSFNTLSEKVHILLVEDNKVNQLMTEKIISNFGFYCDSANDGEEAVDMVKKNKYSIVLMDIMMPKMDGFEATKYIKELDKEIPIIALTAISEKINKEKFEEVGIDKILNKPVNPKLLYETIINCCE